MVHLCNNCSKGWVFYFYDRSPLFSSTLAVLPISFTFAFLRWSGRRRVVKDLAGRKDRELDPIDANKEWYACWPIPFISLKQKGCCGLLHKTAFTLSPFYLPPNHVLYNTQSNRPTSVCLGPDGWQGKRSRRLFCRPTSPYILTYVAISRTYLQHFTLANAEWWCGWRRPYNLWLAVRTFTPPNVRRCNIRLGGRFAWIRPFHLFAI